MKVLGIYFTPSVRQTKQKNWAMVTGRIRGLALAAYYRELSMVNCADTPDAETCVRQVNSAIAWYLWRGDIFGVRLSTLQQPKREGGWDLSNVAAESRALFVHRLQTQGREESSITSKWLQKWDPVKRETNPHTYIGYQHRWKFTHICRSSACVLFQDQSESHTAYKRLLYDTCVP